MMTIFPRSIQAIAVFSLFCGLAISGPSALGQELPFENPLIQLEDPGTKAEKKPAGKPVEATLKPANGKPSELKPGDRVTLAITINVPAGSYTYSTTMPKGQKTRITISQTTGLEPAGKDFQTDREPKTESIPNFGKVEKFTKPVTWTREYRLKEETAIEDVAVEGSVSGQICDDRSCKRLNENFAVALAGSESSNPFVYNERPKTVGDKPGPAQLTVKMSPQDAKPGETVAVSIQLDFDEDWHTYSLTQKPDNAAVASRIAIEESKNLKPLGDGFEPVEAFEVVEQDLGFAKYVQEVHYDSVTWTRKFQVLDQATDNGLAIKGSVTYQACDESRCLRPKTVSFELPHSGEVTKTAAEEPAEEELDLSELASPGQDVKKQGLVWFLISAAGFGFLALLTPCVFPMVPITISFFLKQAESSHHRPATLASVYCGGIIATFTGLGLLMAAIFEATALNQLANNEWLNLGLAAVIIFFGVSMLGMFEIRMPSWLLTWSAGKEQQGGIVGTLFMALTFTLVSFTCTFAFAGLLLVMASKGEVIWPVLGMLAFSAAFSFPFFLLALFPAFLKKLPKSGGWMNTVKVTMGFIEIGAALKFLSVADTSFFGQPVVLTYNVVMVGWLVIAALTGLYLLGLFRMPHDTPAKLSVTRVVFAVPFLLLAVLIGVGTFTNFRPTGVTQQVWQNVVAFAPIQPGEVGNDPNLGPWRKNHGIRYSLSFKQAVQHAQKTNRPLLLDFTGVNCVNCRKMETIIGDADSQERMQSFVAVQLYTDEIPNAEQSGLEDPDRVREMLEMNRKLQRQWFGDVQLPAYAVVHPQDLHVLERFTGMTSEYEEFDKFLAKGLDQWKTHTPGSKKVETAKTKAPSDKAVVERS